MKMMIKNLWNHLIYKKMYLKIVLKNIIMISNENMIFFYVII